MLQELTSGTMANQVVMTMGVGSGELLGEALALAAKRGRVVVTNIHPALEMRANPESARSDADGEVSGRLFVRFG